MKAKGCHAPTGAYKRGAPLPLNLAIEPVGTTESVTHGQWVTFPAAEHHGHRLLAGTKLYCLVTEIHVCEQLAQSCYLIATWPGVKLMTT